MRQKVIWTVALVLALVLALMPSGHTAQAAPYTTVNSTNDLNDGTCDGTHCSLREAIHVANSNSGYADTIRFNITSGCSAGGVCKIQPTSALPALTDDGTTIDGYSQPGADEATDLTPAELLIEIVGISVDSGSGLTINSAGNVIKGLVINGFMSQNGVEIYGSGAMSNTVSGNYIGVNATGTAVTWGNGNGVSISGGAQNNTVGGDTAAERNVISGNWDGVHIEGSGTTGNTVSGNYIGTNATGTADLDNGSAGVYIGGGAQNNTIGGHWTWGERNVISGNGRIGVEIYGSGTTGNIVSGNYIGTDEGGTAYLRNRWNGVVIGGGAQNNTVGGDTAGERNVISGNEGDGVVISRSGTMSNTVSGNYIGTNATGTADLGNGNVGVYIAEGAQNNTVGGDTLGERNVISDNGWGGVHIRGSDTMSNTVSGNYIGTNATGTADLGNRGSGGVFIAEGAQNNTVGGDWTAGERNVISGNDSYGVRIRDSGTTGNTVSGNYIGTNATGTADLGNTWSGVSISEGAQNNTVGGDTLGERNVISGNGWEGVCIEGSGTMSNTVSGNYIGTNATGTADLGNTESGVHIWDDAQNNTVGPGNVIAYNGWDGVDVYGSSTTGNAVTQNSIFSNTVGINLLSGANGGIAAPVIVTTTVGSVKVIGTACGGCTVEVFENGDTDGEGETYVGDTTATSSGAFTVTASYITKPYLTATATDETDGTSEFSEVFEATVELAPPTGPVYLPIILRNY